MALIECPECGNLISEDAKTCPHCGKECEKKDGCLKVIFYLLLPFILFSLVGAFLSNTDTQSTSDTQSISDAFIAKCQKIEKEELLSKLSPAIVEILDNIIITMDKKTYGVVIYDAKLFIKSENLYNVNIPTIAKQVVQEMLNILLSRGLDPHKQSIDVVTHVYLNKRGATGKYLSEYYGQAYYRYINDSIKWLD